MVYNCLARAKIQSSKFYWIFQANSCWVIVPQPARRHAMSQPDRRHAMSQPAGRHAMSQPAGRHAISQPARRHAMSQSQKF